MNTDTIGTLIDTHFTDRERRIIANCVAYAENDPAGLPGHNLALITAKLYRLLRETTQEPLSSGPIEFERRAVCGEWRWGIKGLYDVRGDYDLCRYCKLYHDCGETDIFSAIRTATSISLVVWGCPHFEEG
jgi:hypothetical protein